MNNNGNNDKGQEQVVTQGRLKAYVEWLNTTRGGSYVRVKMGTDGSGKKILTVSSMLKNSSGETTADGVVGIGTVHWVRSDTITTPETKEQSGSSFVLTGDINNYPSGELWLELDGHEYTRLTLPIVIDEGSSRSTGYTGYISLGFTGDTINSGKCVTYSEITGGTYTRYFDEDLMSDGILINSYSIGDGGSYSENQLVVEKDINYGKVNYNLEVHSITVEVDAMTDMREYALGVIPNTNMQEEIPYAKVYNVVNGTPIDFDAYTISGLTDNPETTGKTYKNVTINAGTKAAKARLVQSGSTSAYTVDIYSYEPNGSGYTLTSNTLSTRMGSSGQTTIRVSNHSFSSSTTSSPYSYNAIVKIGKDGLLTFDIKQRKEIYGYFPVDVYRQGTSDYSIDENGNVALSADTKFVKANVLTSQIAFTGNNVYNYVSTYNSGWTDNAGDNFGTDGLSDGKKYLSQNEESVYNPVLIEQGVTDMTLCGKDVYNTNNIVYDRGEEIGNSVYHVAYANDAYGNMDYEGGFLGTKHLFCSGGTMEPEYEVPDCTWRHMDYTYDPFTSDYDYGMEYVRVYYKDLHSYGITSILRRFRKINGTYVDTSKSNYSENRLTQGPIICVPTSETISGNNFPKHILGKTYKYTLRNHWGSSVNAIKSGSHNVTGWTTVFEYEDTGEGGVINTMSYSGEPTVRDISMVANQYSNYYNLVCESTNDSETIFYNAIRPLFYMVDAETCDGYSSGYTFSTPKTITNRAYGVDEVRDYCLDDNHFYLTDNKSNNQACKKDMITYVSYSGNTPIFNSTRYGNEEMDSGVNAECCPSAPLQRVYWVDSYAPYSYYGSTILSNTDPIAFIDSNKNYIGSGTPELYAYDLIPGRSSLNTTLRDITIDAINNFTTYGDYNRSFAGETVYSGGGMNYSSHQLVPSITYTNKNNMQYDANINDYLGYEIDTSKYPYTEPMTAVNLNDFIEDNGTYRYIGSEYVYFDESGTLKTTNSNTECKFLPVKVKNNYYSDGNALRPCKGDVTIPYWHTTLEFAVRLNEEPQDISTYDPISDLGIEVRVAYDVTHYTKLTTSGTLFPNTGDNMVYHQLISNVNERILIARDDETSLRGIYGYLSKKGGIIAGDDTYLQRMELTLLFVDVYPSVNPSRFDVVVNCTKTGMTNQKLHWRLDGKSSQSVGADEFYNMSKNGWWRYEENDKDGYELSCIGSPNDLYSVANMIYLYQGDGSGTINFEDMININESYSKIAMDGDNKGIWY